MAKLLPVVLLLLLHLWHPVVESFPCLRSVALGTTGPSPAPGRAQAGTLVTYGDTADGCASETRLLVDIPRGTLMRLADLGVLAREIKVSFFTHYHSDHMSELYDMLNTRALSLPPPPLLPIVAPEGNVTFTIQHILDAWVPDTQHRQSFLPIFNPSFNLTTFAPNNSLQLVWSSPSNTVNVKTILVNHEMDNAVGYQVVTPVATFGYSGDGRVAAGLNQICTGVSMCSMNSFLDKQGLFQPPFFPAIHANSTHVGTMGQNLNVPVLFMTHLLPPPGGPDGVTTQDWRASIVNKGGFRNKVVIAQDLDEVKFGLMHIVSLTWINIDTTQETPIQHGDTIVFSDADRYTIRANAGAGAENINVVLFTLDGNPENEANVAPYTIGGLRQNGSFRRWDPPTGTYTISAAAYNDANDIFGPPIYVTVTFVQSD